MFVGTWWSLMPPIIAILLALLTKEVYLSLFAGCALGALLVAEFHPWVAFDTLFNTMIDSVDFSILMFMILLGMVVMLMQESGGTRAYGEWAAKKLKSKRATLVATSLLGALIFVDDYFNCLTVGSVMRPVTDKYKVSRAKLAYLIDATAAPVCIIAPISSWAAAVNSYVPAGSSMSGFEMFVRTIPFNLYAMLTLYMVFFTSLLGHVCDFGPHRRQYVLRDGPHHDDRSGIRGAGGCGLRRPYFADLGYDHHVQLRCTVEPHQPRADPDAVRHGRRGGLCARLPDRGLYRKLAHHAGVVACHSDRSPAVSAQAQSGRGRQGIKKNIKKKQCFPSGRHCFFCRGKFRIRPAQSLYFSVPSRICW